MNKYNKKVISTILTISTFAGIGMSYSYAQEQESIFRKDSPNIIEEKILDNGIVKPVPFSERIVEDYSLPAGVTIVVQEGEDGKIETIEKTEKTVFGEIKNLKENVTVPPTERVIRVGVKQETIKGIDDKVTAVESKIIEERKAEQERKKEIERQKEREKERQRVYIEQSNDNRKVESNNNNNVTIVDASATGITSPSENRNFLASIVNGEELNCADKLVMKESGYVTTATNPTSGAYGVAQSLPASKYASHGSDWKTNGKTQILWMKDYVDARYGGFCNALSFHYANNWY